MSTNKPNEKDQLLEELSIQKDQKSELLTKITGSKEYVDYQKNKNSENKAAYKKFLRNFLNEESVLPHFAATGTLLPARGKLLLETYIVKITEDSKDLEQKFEDIVLLKHTDKMKKSSSEEEKQKDEKIKDLVAQLNDKDSDLAKSEEEKVKMQGEKEEAEIRYEGEKENIKKESLNVIDEMETDHEKKLKGATEEQKEKYEKLLREKEAQIKHLKENLVYEWVSPIDWKLNTWMLSATNNQGVLKAQALSPKAMMRRKRLNRLAKAMNKYDIEPGDTEEVWKKKTENAIRYMMSMSSWYAGGRVVNSGTRRWIRNLFNKNRVGKPKDFGEKSLKKIDKFMPDPGIKPEMGQRKQAEGVEIKNLDERIFAKYVREMALYYRAKFSEDRADEWGIWVGTEKAKKPNITSIMS